MPSNVRREVALNASAKLRQRFLAFLERSAAQVFAAQLELSLPKTLSIDSAGARICFDHSTLKIGELSNNIIQKGLAFGRDWSGSVVNSGR
jgi:hypothetical protein